MADRNISVLLSANSASLKQQLAIAGREVKSFGKEVNSASNGVVSSSGIMGKALGAGALVVAAGLAYSVTKAIAFETQMRNVNSISKMSEGALKSLSNQVLEMSTTLPQTAEDLAKGLYDVASSGFQGAQGVTILAASAKAATAGLSTTATAVKAITGVINAYGLEAKDAKYVSDVLFQTVNLGVVTFDELAQSLGQTTGIAAAAKIDIGQVGAAIATMTLSGLDAAESTTALNRLIQALLQPSAELATLYKTLGYESGSSALAQDGLRGVMEKIRIATGGNVDALLKLFPEIRAVKGAMALMAAEGTNYARVARQIEDRTKVAGSTQAAFNEQMKAAGAQFGLMKNKIDAAAISIGTHLLPVLTEAASLLMGAVGEAVSYFADLWGAVAPLLESVGTLIGDLLSDLAPLAGALGLIAAVGILAPLEGLAKVLTLLFDLMDSNRDVVLALGVAFLVLRSNAILAAISSSTVGTAIGVGMLNALSGIQSLIKWLGTLEFTMTAMSGAAATAGKAMLGALLSPGFAVAILAAGLISIALGWRSMQSEAAAYAQEQAKGFKTDNLKSQSDSIKKLTEDWKKAHAEVSNVSFGGFLKAGLDLITANQFISDSALDAAAKQGKLSPVLKQQMEDYQKLNTALQQTTFAQDTLSSALDDSGMSWAGANKEMDKAKQTLIDFAASQHIDMPDPGASQADWNDWADAVAGARREAMNLTPAQADLSKALKTIGDDASTNKEKVDAFKESLDAAFGIHISAFDAATKTAGAFDALTKSMIDNGKSFDIATEKGRSNRDALTSTAKAALDHANAVASETGSLQKGKDVLNLYVQKIRDTLTAAGLAAPEVTSLMQSLGLLDSTGAVVDVAVDGQQAKTDLKELQTLADQLETHKNIHIDAITADADAHLKGWQVTVLDPLGKPQVITVDADTKDASSEIAGFQISKIDPITGKPIMLTVDANTADADLELDGFQARVKQADGTTTTMTIDLNAEDANLQMKGVQKWIQQTDGTFVLTTVDTTWDDEKAKAVDAWNAALHSTDTNIIGHDGSALGRKVVDAWNAAPHRADTWIITHDDGAGHRAAWDSWKPLVKQQYIDTIFRTFGSAPGTGGGPVKQNSVLVGGGPDTDNNPMTSKAQGGVLQFYAKGGIRKPESENEHHEATIAKGTTRVWNEPETGGEAYIPLGQQKRERSTAILSDVASRFGYNMTPQSAMKRTATTHVAGDTITVAPTTVTIQGNADHDTIAQMERHLEDRDRRLVQRIRAKKGRF